MENEEIIQTILKHVQPAAKDHPEVFLYLMVRRAVEDQGADAILQFARAIEDMGRWYQEQAAGIEAVLALREITKGGEA